jgi:hypothetical protein
MRFVFLLLFIVGVSIGIGYPVLVSNVSGYEIGRYPAYDRQGGYRSIDVALAPPDAPVRVLVDMASLGGTTLDGAQTALTLTASLGGRTVLASTLTFAHSQPRSDDPQSGGLVFRDEAGVIDPVDGGTYRFVVGPGDVERIEMRSVDVVLRAGAFDLDPRLVPIGYTLMAFGFVGFFVSVRSRGKTPPDAPPPPKWGR